MTKIRPIFWGWCLFALVVSAGGCGSSASGGSSDNEEEEQEEQDDAEDDLTAPGLPETKTTYTGLDARYGARDRRYYDFIDNLDDDRLLTEEMHGTEVNVAVHNTVDLDDETAQELERKCSRLLAFCLACFWGIFLRQVCCVGPFD